MRHTDIHNNKIRLFLPYQFQPFFSVYGVSLCGAAAHNIGQILVAALTLSSVYIFAYLPFLLLVGLVTGMLTGAVASACFRALIASGQWSLPQ